MKAKKQKKMYIPRIQPTISTSSKVFLSKKDKLNSRQRLNKIDYSAC